MLSSDTWLEQQLAAELSQNVDLEKLIRMEQFKISQAKLRVCKVQEGWEKGFYTPEEVQIKLAEHRQAIGEAESEIQRLPGQILKKGLSTGDIGLHPYDWTEEVRRVWQGSAIFSCTSINLSKSFGER